MKGKWQKATAQGQSPMTMHPVFGGRIYVFLTFGIFILIGSILLMTNLLGLFGNIHINESITVDGSVSDAFASVTDINNADRISEHLVDIQQLTDGAQNEVVQYSRTLLIHGSPNAQVVTVTQYDQDRMYATTTELYGFEISYTYQFILIDESTVQISLTKEASGRGWVKILSPLIRHLLTRLEHDGKHLITLKAVIES
jgi:hypothetical protein